MHTLGRVEAESLSKVSMLYEKKQETTQAYGGQQQSRRRPHKNAKQLIHTGGPRESHDTYGARPRLEQSRVPPSRHEKTKHNVLPQSTGVAEDRWVRSVVKPAGSVTAVPISVRIA